MPTSDDRARWGRIGALESWAKTEDRSARTAAARQAFERRFDKYPDPEAARRAYYARLAEKSLKARRARRAADRPSDDAAA